jgi:hypothetical protein
MSVLVFCKMTSFTISLLFDIYSVLRIFMWAWLGTFLVFII